MLETFETIARTTSRSTPGNDTVGVRIGPVVAHLLDEGVAASVLEESHSAVSCTETGRVVAFHLTPGHNLPAIAMQKSVRGLHLAVK